jgi:hypothetical protein
VDQRDAEVRAWLSEPAVDRRALNISAEIRLSVGERTARRAVPTQGHSKYSGLRFPFERCICLPPATHGRHLPPGNEKPQLGQHAVLPLPEATGGFSGLKLAILDYDETQDRGYPSRRGLGSSDPRLFFYTTTMVMRSRRPSSARLG